MRCSVCKLGDIFRVSRYSIVLCYFMYWLCSNVFYGLCLFVVEKPMKMTLWTTSRDDFNNYSVVSSAAARKINTIILTRLELNGGVVILFVLKYNDTYHYQAAINHFTICGERFFPFISLLLESYISSITRQMDSLSTPVLQHRLRTSSTIKTNFPCRTVQTTVLPSLVSATQF